MTSLSVGYCQYVRFSVQQLKFRVLKRKKGSSNALTSAYTQCSILKLFIRRISAIGIVSDTRFF
jgi:hypothetical protein